MAVTPSRYSWRFGTTREVRVQTNYESSLHGQALFAFVRIVSLKVGRGGKVPPAGGALFR